MARERHPAAWLVLVIFGGAMVVLAFVLAEVALRVGDLRNGAVADPRCAGSDASQLTQKGLFALDVAAGYVMRPNWERPQRELRAQATAAGVPVIELLPAFQDRSDRDELYLPIDQHFSGLGHRATAQLLADGIVSARWLP